MPETLIRRARRALLVLGLALAVGPVCAEAPALPGELVPITAPSGAERLLASTERAPYWALSANFETQQNQAYCAVASAVVALNALGVPRPANHVYPDYPYFTQQEFFRDVPSVLANPETVSHEGMTRDQLATVLVHLDIKVANYAGDGLDEAGFRKLLKDTLRRADRVLLVNFLRSAIGENGGGHWSPLAAYDAASDSVLLLDVARYRYPPVWVPVVTLWQAIRTEDSVSGESRGVLVVEKP